MSLQGNGNNHNFRPNLNDENDSFLKFNDSEEYAKITGQAPTSVEQDGSVEFGAVEDERKKKLQEAIERENSSAYEDLDDFVYRQNKRRAKTSGHRHHHRHISPSVLSPGRARRKSTSSSKKKHRHKHHYHRHHKKKRMKKWQKVSLGIIISLISLIVIMIIAVVLMYFAGKNALLDDGGLNINPPDYVETTNNGQYIFYKGHKYKYNDRMTSVLCIGADRDAEITRIDGDNQEFATGGQADSLFLVSMDVDTGKVNLVNISRETMAEVNVYTSRGKAAGSRTEQICLAYAYGNGGRTSCQNELVAVRRLFYNLPINFFLSLNIDGIAQINDSVGGVLVKSPETIAEFHEGETYKLQGTLAESFVRSRSHETYKGNSLRMERQKVYLEAFAQNVFTKTRAKLTVPLDVYNIAKPYITTNIGLNEVAYFTVTALRGGFTGLDVQNVPGKTKQGEKYAEFYVNEKKFFEMFLDLYYIRVD
ncbi:MAG: LCP family protein [Ruminococcus sp.]|nr:LCP family protein [Ruminococcus sp.]